MNAPKIGIALFTLFVLVAVPFFAQDLPFSTKRYIQLESSPADHRGVGAGKTEKPDAESGQSDSDGRGVRRLAFISPNLDGIQDNLLLPLRITDERYITSYSLAIRNVDGVLIRSIKNKETRPETADFGNLIDRFFRLKEGLKLPKILVWDGRDESGAVVADGLYSYEFTATDDNGNSSRVAPRYVLVDTKIPILKVDAPQTAFAPGGDRSRLLINQGCDESLAPVEQWDAAFYDSQGLLVRSWTYRGSLPGQTVWDGKNNEGIFYAIAC